MLGRGGEGHTQVSGEHSDTAVYTQIFYYLYPSCLYIHLDTGAGIHGDDEERIEMREDVLVDDEDAGVKPHEECCEEVTDDQGESKVDTGEDYHVSQLVSHWPVLLNPGTNITLG